jgi:aminoglycoside phosphotransferase (APT) family kinase protein
MTAAGPAAGTDDDDRFPAELALLLQESLPDQPVEVVSLTRAAGGLSWETWYCEVAAGADRSHRTLVAKRPPLDGPLAPYDVGKEVAIARVLATAGVPGPRVVAHSPGPDVGGRPVMVMEFAEGEIPSLRSIERWPAWQDPERRSAAGTAMVELLAALQRVDWRATAAVSEVLGGGLGAAAHVGAAIDLRMEKVERAVTPRWVASPVLRDGWLWLTDNVPPLGPDQTVIVHGDFRVGNVVWGDDRPVALLDWERATLGDPMCDLAFFCMPMARARRPELMGMLLTVDELLAAWKEATGGAVDLRRLHYYLAYWQWVELAQVTHGISYLLDRAPDGDTTSLTSYPLLASGTVELVELIERYEDGDHGLR